MDIQNIFRSKTRKALFRLYFTNPESEYYLRELERLLAIPVSMIRKELCRLEDEKVFISRKRGNLLYYSLNKSYPLFEELKSIVFKTIGAEGLLKQALRPIKGVNAAFIYGSFANTNEKPASDIDILIIGDIDEGDLVSKVNKIERMLKREINYTIYSKAEFKKKKSLKDAFITNLLENKKIFLMGDKHDL